MAKKRSSQHRLRNILLTTLVLFGVSIVVWYYLIGTIDMEEYRPRITSFFKQGLGREVRIDGKIELEPSLWPRIVVENLAIGNPAWAAVPDFVTVKHLDFQVELLPLLKRELKILKLDLIGVDAHLERNNEGIPNWLMTWRNGDRLQDNILPTVMPVYIKDSTLTLHAKKRPSVTISLHRLNAMLGMEEPFSLEGTVNLEELPVGFSLKGDLLKQLLLNRSPWSVRGSVWLDRLPFTIKGTVTDPVRLQDIRLALSTGSTGDTSPDHITGDPINIGNVMIDIHISARETGQQVAIKSKVSKLDLTEWISHKKWRPVSSVKLDHLESTFESNGRSINDLILNGRLRLQANQGEIQWLSEDMSEPDVLRTKSISIQGDPGQPIKTQLVSTLGATKTLISVEHGRIVNLLWSDTAWPFRIRCQAAGLDTAIQGNIGPPGKQRKITGTAYVTAGEVEQIGRFFKHEWPKLGPAHIKGDFAIDRSQMQLNDIEGIFTGAPFSGNLTVKTGKSSRFLMNLSMKGFDAGRLIPGNSLDTGISIKADLLRLGMDGSGVSISESFSNAKLNLIATAGHVTWHDRKGGRQEVSIKDFTVNNAQNRSIDFKINASVSDMGINMNGKLENLLSLNRGDSSIPAELNLRGDGLLADFKGDLSVLDEKVRVGGSVAIQVNPMNTWAKLLGVDWPYAKPLSVSTELDYQPDRLSMQNVKIASTGVKAKGKISFAADASPKLQINVNEGIIDLAEFINPIDEEIDSSSVAEKSKKVDKDRVIPDFSLESELIESMDAQIRIDSIEVMSRGEQITKLNGKVGCTNGILSFSPLKGQSSVGSKTTVEMTWDTTPQPSKATLSWKTKDIDYGLIIKKLGIRDDIVGKLDLKLNVDEGQGLTLREILSSTNGEMEILFGKGHTPRHALEFWGDELLRLLIPTNWIKADITDLNCAVGRFDIRNGVIKSNVLLMDTRRITVVGEIGVDLKTEEISGLFEPKNKQAALLRLGTPIKLGGTMANITGEPAGSRVVFLGKMLLGLTHPSTLLLLFGDLGTAEKNPCKELLEKLSSEDLETVSP